MKERLRAHRAFSPLLRTYAVKIKQASCWESSMAPEPQHSRGGSQSESEAHGNGVVSAGSHCPRPGELSAYLLLLGRPHLRGGGGVGCVLMPKVILGTALDDLKSRFFSAREPTATPDALEWISSKTQSCWCLGVK